MPMAWLNLKNGPVVVETPPNSLGLVDDFWFRYVTDLGLAGPDKGKGGKFLFLPPDFMGNLPEGYYIFKSRTFKISLPRAAFWLTVIRSRLWTASSSISGSIRWRKPPIRRPRTSSTSRAKHSTRSTQWISFFEEVNEVMQEEPSDVMDPETLGLLASIGIEKGKPFAPDARMKKILTEAAAVGHATARALRIDRQLNDAYFYPDSAWNTPFVGGSHEFLHNGVRLLDARSYFFFYATGITPAMAAHRVGVGSAYAAAFVDAKGQPFDGSKTYRLHLPPNIPAKQFWSLVLYDNQTRSMLQTDQQFPSIGSQKKGVVSNPDTSVDVYFGPKAPAGKEGNWVQTWPGKGWNIILRLYGPLQPFFDKTWRPSEIEELS